MGWCREGLLLLLALSSAPAGLAVRLPAAHDYNMDFVGSLRTNYARQHIRFLRETPWWKQKRSKWDDFARTFGHGLERHRDCPRMTDWMGDMGPYVVPRLKLAFCYVPKAACTNFKDLFNSLNELAHSPRGFGGGYQDSMPRKLRYPFSTVTKENGWTFAAFTRDPLERYLSTYGSTCVAMPNDYFEHPDECCGEVTHYGASNETVRQKFEERAVSDSAEGVPYEDDHWSTQVQVLHNCGWDKFRPDKLDFRGDISAGNMNRQVKEMLQLVNATAADLKWVEDLFPQGHYHGHQSPIRAEPAFLYRKKETVDAVKRIYEADYELIPGVGKHFTDKLHELA